jgi:hypothetical protein
MLCMWFFASLCVRLHIVPSTVCVHNACATQPQAEGGGGADRLLAGEQGAAARRGAGQQQEQQVALLLLASWASSM